jgi:hypothetical protein
MINSSSDAAGTDLAKPPEITPEERAVLSAHITRRKQKRPSPRVKLVEKAGSAVELSADHPIPHLGNALIMESLGTADFDFYDGLLTQLANVGTQEKTLDERGTNFMLAMVRGIGPKDEVEAMMAAQMAAVHMATMTFARRLVHVDNILQQACVPGGHTGLYSGPGCRDVGRLPASADRPGETKALDLAGTAR